MLIFSPFNMKFVYDRNSFVIVSVRLDDSVSRADLENINPDVEKLTMIKQTKVRVIFATTLTTKKLQILTT